MSSVSMCSIPKSFGEASCDQLPFDFKKTTKDLEPLIHFSYAVMQEHVLGQTKALIPLTGVNLPTMFSKSGKAFT